MPEPKSDIKYGYVVERFADAETATTVMDAIMNFGYTYTVATIALYCLLMALVWLFAMWKIRRFYMYGFIVAVIYIVLLYYSSSRRCVIISGYGKFLWKYISGMHWRD